MSNVRMEPFVITVKPGQHAKRAAMRCARYIVDRWMPGNAGGVHLLVTPRLGKNLLIFWEKAEAQRRPIQIRVSLSGHVPEICEIATAPGSEARDG